MTVVAAAGNERLTLECDAWIKSCRSLANLQAIHKRIILRHGGLFLDRNTGLSNLLLQRYARCGSLDHAEQIFAAIRDKDVISWNAMLSAYARTGHHTAQAKLLFDSIPDRDRVSWNAMLGAYVHAGNLQECKDIFDRFPERDIVSWNSLLAAYAQKGQMDKAQVVFDQMPERGLITWNTMLAANSRNNHVAQAKKLFDEMPERDYISWNTMMNAYTQAGHSREAKELFDQMPARDIVSWNGLLIMYGTSGKTDPARSVFDAMPYRDLVCWNVMVSVYAQSGHLDPARELFDRAPERDIVVWNAMLSAYAKAAAAAYNRKRQRDVTLSKMVVDIKPVGADGSEVHPTTFASKEKDSEIEDEDEEERRRCHRDLEAARELFDAMPDRNVISWTTMLTLYAQSGHVGEAKRIFDHALMPERDVVCWNALLAAYAQAGNTPAATRIFALMPSRNLESTNVMLAMLFHSSNSRSIARGRRIFARSIRDGIAPDEVSFVHMLFACSHSGGLSAGLRYFRSMAMDFALRGTKQQYSIMIDIIARAGHLEDARELITNMPFLPDSRDWTSLLDACRSSSGKSAMKERVIDVARHAIRSDPRDSALYVLSTNNL
ncbi:pentatricopeptide repeat-containing protein At4g02750-like [Selaginella moellendorffii]|uniref:pentatricopeptide repeat-containing protein At4g02750-like n=1 Tax=Selaginella moellendorffii TaxID=88036 RepID=UPI000D1CDF2B|nr:pentatricopeptide repeat-containing protein At4g02750-like [Selaginella moellendorffii]|eukprot:XP_024515041.1 pentatricopeptide repeat-containing protein At4g02750-like [Selaginella moellendorffii]